jgi:dihydrofolate reductase
MIIGIVAIAKNFAIGKDGKLPWHHSADLKFFKQTTTGNAVVMGANTWRSIGKALPDRLNVVLTHSSGLVTPSAVMKLESVDEVLDLAKYLNRDVYIIGGAKVFAAFADHIDRWIVTTVPDEVEDADTFMPEDFLDGFNEQKFTQLTDDLVVREYDKARSK